jgi:hypothetical protein
MKREETGERGEMVGNLDHGEGDERGDTEADNNACAS